MNALFDRLTLADVRRDVARNIVALRAPQDPFDDLSDDSADWRLAEAVQEAAWPGPPRPGASPNESLIDRPFDDAAWFNAIAWPFRHWRASRFSDGSHAVWYGSDSVETTVHETAFHWIRGFLGDAGFAREGVVAEREVYRVACAAALLDFRGAAKRHPRLLHPDDYTFSQAVGARIHREGHPGLLVPSVRRPAGENAVVFNPRVLSNPRPDCRLTYRIEGGRVVVEKTSGTVWMALEVGALVGSR